MNESGKKKLSTLLSASRQLAECAADGEWETVAELQMQQRDLIANYFANNDHQPMTAEIMSGIAHVRVYTDMVLQLATRKRAALAGAADKVKTGRSAVNAYAECS